VIAALGVAALIWPTGRSILADTLAYGPRQPGAASSPGCLQARIRSAASPPSEKNPRRPVASTDRYEAMRAVADRVTMKIRHDGHRREQPSYLPELLDIAAGAGRRITAIAHCESPTSS
jgi:hypothetical protein